MNPVAAQRLVGPKIRDRRRALEITQANLSATLGISPSYLNLIEAGKRNIGGALLKRIAAALGLSVEDLDGAAERRLLADLGELAAEPVLGPLRLEAGALPDLAARHPAWARALLVLHRAWLDRGRSVNALSERLRHDPFLADAMHDLLTRVAAIRSSAEIVEQVDDLPPDRLNRFAAIVGSESRRLADLAQALAAYFDRAHTSIRSVTPVGEVDDFLVDRQHHFAALEAAAVEWRTSAGIRGPCTEPLVTAHLERHDVTAPAGATRIELALLAAELACGDALSAEVAQAGTLSSDAARRRARRALATYLAGAMVMPYEEFLAAARRLRYDIDALGRAFGTSFEQTCHRLVTLRRPGHEGVPFALMQVDASGYTIRRAPMPRLPLPRHGSACPLWAVYLALQSPGAIVRQLAEFPGRERFLFVARTVESQGPSFPMPRRMGSVMLACDAHDGDQLVYGDGLDLGLAAPAVPVGANCRVCTRTDCAFRQEDPVIDA